MNSKMDTSKWVNSKPVDDITVELLVSPKIVNISSFPAAYTTQATWFERLDLTFPFASLKIPNNRFVPPVIWRQYRSAWKLLSCKYTKAFAWLPVKTTVRSMEVSIAWVLLLFCNKFILLGKWFNYKVLVFFFSWSSIVMRSIGLSRLYRRRSVWFDVRFNLLCLLV